MTRARALAVVAVPGAIVGAAIVAIGRPGWWGLILLATLLAGLAEIGGG